MRELYVSGLYTEKRPTWHKEDSPWKVQQMCRVFDFKEPMKICDIGCGVGGVLIALNDILSEKCSMAGYDISSLAIERAQENAPDNILYECCDILEMEKLDYDLCLLIDILEHLENPVDFLLKLYQKGLREFIINLPIEGHLMGKLRGKTDPKNSPVGHLHFFNTRTALKLLKDAELTINKWVYTPEFELDIKFHRTPLSVLAYPFRKGLFSIWSKLMVETLGGVSLMSWCSHSD